MLSGFGDVLRAHAADGVDRERNVFAEAGEAFPAQGRGIGMGGGGTQAAEYGEIAAQGFGYLQIVGGMTGGGDQGTFCQRPFRYVAQLGSAQLHAGV